MSTEKPEITVIDVRVDFQNPVNIFAVVRFRTPSPKGTSEIRERTFPLEDAHQKTLEEIILLADSAL